MGILRKNVLAIGEIYVFCPLYLATYPLKPIIGIHHVPLKYLDGFLENSSTQDMLSTSLKKMTLLKNRSACFGICCGACRVISYEKFDVITLCYPGGGVKNDPHQGFPSVVFARGMISKRNFG